MHIFGHELQSVSSVQAEARQCRSKLLAPNVKGSLTSLARRVTTG